MYRSCFYMNQRFTVRHLNAIRSPLMTGFVSPLSGSPHTSTLINPPAMASASACGAAMNAPLVEELLSGVDAAGTTANSSLLLAWAELSARPIFASSTAVVIKVLILINCTQEPPANPFASPTAFTEWAAVDFACSNLLVVG